MLQWWLQNSLNTEVPSSEISTFYVSVTHGQQLSQSMKWKIPGIKMSRFKLSTIPSSTRESATNQLHPSQTWIIPDPKTTPYMLPTHLFLSSQLEYQLNYTSTIVPALSEPLLYLVMDQSPRRVTIQFYDHHTVMGHSNYVNLLLCRIYKLSFIRGMFTPGNTVLFSIIDSCKHPPRTLQHIRTKRGL